MEAIGDQKLTVQVATDTNVLLDRAMEHNVQLSHVLCIVQSFLSRAVGRDTAPPLQSEAVSDPIGMRNALGTELDKQQSIIGELRAVCCLLEKIA